jgi:CBS domain-containing protein
MQVKDVMTAKPSYCEPYWTVEAVASLMDHVGTGIVPVVQDVLSRKLVGVVTDRDLCIRVVAPGQYPAHTWVSSCMTANPVCCHAEDDVGTALRLMRERQVRRLPVVDEQMRLEGIVSISDFIRTEAADRGLIYGALQEICQAGGTARLPQAA